VTERASTAPVRNRRFREQGWRRMLEPACLFVAGFAMLGWAGWSNQRSSPLPYEQVTAPASSTSLADFSAGSLDRAKPERIEIRAPEAAKGPIATGVVIRDPAGRPTPLDWRNATTEPIFFADTDPADTAKVLAAIREHAPPEAVILAWWDMSRRIRILAGRQAPLDDPLARGLLTPSAWTADVSAINESQRAYWGAGVPRPEGEVFAKFVDALLMDDARGVAALAEIAGGKEVFVAVRLSDIWKAAAVRPDLLSISYRDFPGGGDAHRVMKAAREWMQDNAIEGSFAVETMGAATRLHYLPRKADAARLLTRMLPFSTSNPLKLERLQLVYQHKGFWIYRLLAPKG
jgi:hydroxylamine oxidation protein HaoB